MTASTRTAAVDEVAEPVSGPSPAAEQAIDAVIDIAGLSVTLPTARGSVEAVRGIDLTVRRGECLAIVGESGSGKSITARTLAGLLPRQAEVGVERFLINGADATAFGEQQWRGVRGPVIGFVLQDALVSLDPLRPLGKEVSEAFTTRGIVRGRAAIAARVRDLLESVGMPEPDQRARQYAVQLSGGLRQRGLIASGLSADPQLLIADEPTTALDVTVQAQVLDLLDQKKRGGTTLLLISHDLAVVSKIADRVLVMRNGEVVEEGPTATVLGDPHHPYTRKLLRAIPSGASKGFRLGDPGQPDLDPGQPDLDPGQPDLDPGQPDLDPDPTAQRQRLTPRTIHSDRTVLAVDAVSKQFAVGHRRTVAVDEVSLDVAAGETLGIVGESGSGKSTLARLMLGLLDPDAGEIRLTDQPWSSVGERRRRSDRGRIQLIAQDPLSSFDPRFSTERVIGESLDTVGIRGAERRERVAALLQDVGLPAEIAGRNPRSLSGGQRQRVAIARALAPRPELIIADEPVSALDVSVQAQILDLLADIQAETGTSMIFISHDLGVVHHVADQVVVMRNGRIVERGDVGDVFARPGHPYTRQLLAAVPAIAR